VNVTPRDSRQFCRRQIRGAVAIVAAAWLLPSNEAAGQYTESFQIWSATSADTWQTKSLAGAPFNVPANAVVEIAIRNDRNTEELYGGVRAVGSSLDRRLPLMEAESNGATALVMHVQADASSQIQHYSDTTTEVDFVLLGYWTSGTYVERFDTFAAGASGSWTDKSLCSYGLRPGYVAEVVMTNDDGLNAREAGLRTKGSSLQRRLNINAVEGGGVAPATMLVKTDTSAAARVQVYAQDDADIDFYVVGYWSVAPRAYTELIGDIGNPTASATWQDKDLTARGVPDSAIAEIALSQQYLGDGPQEMGVRANGSSLGRILDLHKAQVGGGNLGRMHVATDAGAVIEFYFEDVAQSHTFYVTGYWSTCDTSLSYIVTDLGAVTSSKSSVGYHIDSSGKVAGFEEDASGNPAAWYLDCGSFTSLGTLGGASAEAHGVNDAGRLAGWAHIASGRRRAFSWTSGGGMVDLGTVSGRLDSEALSVNSSNEVVGTVNDFGAPPTNRLAFLYLPSGAYTLSAGMNSLGTLGGAQSVGMDVNDTGRVVGGAQNAGGNFRPFRWNSGTMTDLGTLGGDNTRSDHRAEAVNSSGNICGRSYTAGGAARAFYWDGSMTNLGVLTGGTASWAFGLNDGNTVAGTSDVTGGAYHAFVWDNSNGMRDLNDLISAGSGWTLTRATDINNSGQITGWGTNGSGDVRAFLLTPTCSAGGGAAALIVGGGGQVGPDGTFDETAVDDEGMQLAGIEVLTADVGTQISYQLLDPTATSGSGGPMDPAGRPGFADGVSLPRTFTVESLSPPQRTVMVISMSFTMAEVRNLDLESGDLELHVLNSAGDDATAKWVPAGANVGESAPTDVVGESGFVELDDGLVDYWAVRNGGGTFAVGPRDIENDPSPPPPGDVSMPRTCGIAAVQPLLLCCGVLLLARGRQRRP